MQHIGDALRALQHCILHHGHCQVGAPRGPEALGPVLIEAGPLGALQSSGKVVLRQGAGGSCRGASRAGQEAIVQGKDGHNASSIHGLGLACIRCILGCLQGCAVHGAKAAAAPRVAALALVHLVKEGSAPARGEGAVHCQLPHHSAYPIVCGIWVGHVPKRILCAPGLRCQAKGPCGWVVQPKVLIGRVVCSQRALRKQPEGNLDLAVLEYHGAIVTSLLQEIQQVRCCLCLQHLPNTHRSTPRVPRLPTIASHTEF